MTEKQGRGFNRNSLSTEDIEFYQYATFNSVLQSITKRDLYKYAWGKQKGAR